MTNYELPTPPQVGFINALLRDRDVPSNLLEAAKVCRSKAEASMLITALKALPWKPKAPAAAGAYPEYLDALKAAEVSKYAVPTRYLHAAFPEFAATLKGDLLFLEVRNIGHGKRVFRRLVGAPGRFSRYNLPVAVRVGLLRFINGRHVEFARLFSEHYSVCGRCAAELTDADSRAAGFGPECRKVFGI